MKKRTSPKPFTLSIDIGGTMLKASVLDAKGKMVTASQRVATPYPCTPKVMIAALARMAQVLPSFSRVSIGFPGVVREGRVITAPHFGNKLWRDFPLVRVLQNKWGKPVRLLNDADMQGSAVVQGKGLELVVTLGTGVGTALFMNGRLMQRMELAQHPVWDNKTYNEFIGDKVLKRIGPKAWNLRVEKALGFLNTLLNPDRVYIGGGNARLVRFKLGRNIRLVSNDAGILGGIALWERSGTGL